MNTLGYIVVFTAIMTGVSLFISSFNKRRVESARLKLRLIALIYFTIGVGLCLVGLLIDGNTSKASLAGIITACSAAYTFIHIVYMLKK